MPNKQEMPTTCSFEGCKQTTSIAIPECKVCCLKFCLSHRLPEVHNPKCAQTNNKTIQAQAKRDSLLMASMIERDGNKAALGGAAALEKERKDIKKRLRNKIKNARK